MDADTVLRIGREALLLVLLCSAGPVLAAMLVGLTVSVFSAATQIQEQTLSFVPKIVAAYAVIAIAGFWILQQVSGPVHGGPVRVDPADRPVIFHHKDTKAQSGKKGPQMTQMPADYTAQIWNYLCGSAQSAALPLLRAFVPSW